LYQLDHTLIDSKVLLYTVLHEVEGVVPMVGEGVEEVEEAVVEGAHLPKVEEVVEEVVRKVGLMVARPEFRLLVLHEVVLHRKVVLLRKVVLPPVVLPPVVLPPVVLQMGVLQVEGAVVAEKWVELLLGPKCFE